MTDTPPPTASLANALPPGLAVPDQGPRSANPDGSEAPARELAPAATQGTRRKTSDVYEFIQERSDGLYECTLCRVGGAGGGPWKYGVSNFRNHLSSCHPDMYKPPAKSAKKRLASVIDAAADHQHGHVFRQEDVDEKLIDWIVANSHPFSVVEQPEFIEFVAALQPGYAVPKRKAVKAKIIERWKLAKEDVRRSVISDTEGRRIGITTDMWTSASKRGYMVVTLHYIDDEWEMQAVIVGFIRVHYPHSGRRLADHLIHAVKKMDGVLLSSLWAITSDNASNNSTMTAVINEKLQGAIDAHALDSMRASASEISTSPTPPPPIARRVFQVHCVAHVLQLAVKEGLKVVPSIHTSIGRFRDVLKKLHDSPKLLERFTVICNDVGTKFSKPVLDCETRWNSTWMMMQWVLTSRKPLEELLRRIRERHDGYRDFTLSSDSALVEHIHEDAWSNVAQFCGFLKPFYQATVFMSGSGYPTLGMMLLTYHIIAQHTSEATKTLTSESGFQFANAVKAKLDAYAPITDIRENRMAAAFDPRAKRYLDEMGIDTYKVRDDIIAEYNHEYEPKFERMRRRQSSTPQKDTHTDSFLRVLAAKHLGAEFPSRVTAEPFAMELERWLTSRFMNLDKKSRDVMTFFRDNGDMFPRVQMMARDYLGVTATSVPSECAFSAAGDVVSNKRARLGDDSVQAIVELQSFLKFRRRGRMG